MISKLLMFFFFLINPISWAQYPMILKGKLVAKNSNPSNILVANLSLEKTVVSDDNGNFSIEASPDDLLVFSGMQIEYTRKMIDEVDFNKTIEIHLTPKTIEIQEVEIQHFKEIDAVSLGILVKPAKKYTPQERKLRTAETFFWYSPLLIPFGGMSVDGLINKINGKTTQIKKDIVIEQKLNSVAFLKKMSSEREFDFLNISDQAQLEAFFYFAVENEVFLTIAITKNRSEIKRAIVSTFNKYNEK